MKLFITGASGFIGGAVATSMVKAGHEVRGLIRNPERAAELRGFGIEPVLGTLDDAALLAAEARAADAVINAADSDHRGAVEALLGALGAPGHLLQLATAALPQLSQLTLPGLLTLLQHLSHRRLALLQATPQSCHLLLLLPQPLL